MSTSLPRAMTVLSVGMIITTAMVLPSFAASSSYLTTNISQSGIKQTTINGIGGVLVNYTSTFSTSFSSFVYLYLVNPAGQTVYVGLGTCSFAPAQKVQCFAAIAGAVPTGHYTANVFVTTTTGVPVSSTSSLSITI
jgi:hypothetical protein